MILARDVNKSYPTQDVLRGVSLSVLAGEIFGFVGPNGAGKTTFLKCLAGIVRPQSGELVVGGVDVRTQPLAARRLIGYAPGETAMYDSMRVLGFLKFAIGFHHGANLKFGRELLARFEVPERKLVSSLSHGMKRKLLLAQAISSGAPVLLLDEPMEGLDPEARRLVEEMMRDMAAEGRTVFFSSHDLASVERVCDRVAFLREGRLLECAPVAEILDRVAHLVQVRFQREMDREDLPTAGGLSWEGSGRDWRLSYEGNLASTLAALSALPVARVRDTSSLEDVFKALYGEEEGA